MPSSSADDIKHWYRSHWIPRFPFLVSAIAFIRLVPAWLGSLFTLASGIPFLWENYEEKFIHKIGILFVRYRAPFISRSPMMMMLPVVLCKQKRKQIRNNCFDFEGVVVDWDELLSDVVRQWGATTSATMGIASMSDANASRCGYFELTISSPESSTKFCIANQSKHSNLSHDKSSSWKSK